MVEVVVGGVVIAVVVVVVVVVVVIVASVALVEVSTSDSIFSIVVFHRYIPDWLIPNFASCASLWNLRSGGVQCGEVGEDLVCSTVSVL